jgi:hypothetical protein
VFPPGVFVRESTRATVSHTPQNDLNLNAVMLMVWSEAPSDPKVKELLAGAQIKYRDSLTGVVRNWQKRGEIAPKGRPASIGKAILSFFLGFVVQSALISVAQNGPSELRKPSRLPRTDPVQLSNSRVPSRSVEFLGESDEKPFRPADVAKPIRVLIPDYFAYELCAAVAKPAKRLVDVVHGEHDAEVA